MCSSVSKRRGSVGIHWSWPLSILATIKINNVCSSDSWWMIFFWSRINVGVKYYYGLGKCRAGYGSHAPIFRKVQVGNKWAGNYWKKMYCSLWTRVSLLQFLMRPWVMHGDFRCLCLFLFKFPWRIKCFFLVFVTISSNMLYYGLVSASADVSRRVNILGWKRSHLRLRSELGSFTDGEKLWWSKQS